MHFIGVMTKVRLLSQYRLPFFLAGGQVKWSSEPRPQLLPNCSSKLEIMLPISDGFMEKNIIGYLYPTDFISCNCVKLDKKITFGPEIGTT